MPLEENLRVVLVEDNRILATQLSRRLSRRGCTVTTVATLAGAQEAIADEAFDVAILDLVLPDGRSEALLPALRRQDTNPAIIVLTGHLDAKTAVALSAECDVVIPKPAQLDVILDAIDSATGSERLRRVVHGYCQCAGLSLREEEVLWGAVQGLSTEQIADEVGVSNGSIRTYWHRILKKTGHETQRDALTAVLRFTFRL